MIIEPSMLEQIYSQAEEVARENEQTVLPISRWTENEMKKAGDNYYYITLSQLKNILKRLQD